MPFGQSSLSLDECSKLIRDGQSPKDVAEIIGISERSLAELYTRQGREDEYKVIKQMSMSVASTKVDVEKVMEYADKGISIKKACVMLGIPRSVVIRKLDDDGRHIEYEVRSISASHGIGIPEVDPEGYKAHREALVSTIPLLPEEARQRVTEAIRWMDSTVKNAAKLSRMCRRSEI